jgi:predicted acylesterase/phospholipase RssA
MERCGMDRVRPPEFTDWVDAVVGALVLVGGGVFASFMAGVLAYW